MINAPCVPEEFSSVPVHWFQCGGICGPCSGARSNQRGGIVSLGVWRVRQEGPLKIAFHGSLEVPNWHEPACRGVWRSLVTGGTCHIHPVIKPQIWEPGHPQFRVCGPFQGLPSALDVLPLRCHGVVGRSRRS